MTTTIRKDRKRLVTILNMQNSPSIEFTINDIEVREDNGQVQVHFSYKPSEETRKVLKSYPLSLKWSRYSTAWVRKITPNVGQQFIDALKDILNKEDIES